MHALDFAYTISVVEDEDVLRQELTFQLGHLGFKVEAFKNAAQLYRYLAVRPATIAVLDIGLDGEDGLSICQYLRAHDLSMGIVFVSARGMRNDRLTGLAAGADAYLTKPVDIEELVLVLKRLALRFTANKKSAEPPKRDAKSSWSMEPNSILLLAPNGVRVKVSPNEAKILRTLLKKEGVPCTHAELGISLGLHPDELDKHRIEVILSRLGTKVERMCGVALPIQSFRSVGYALLPDGAQDRVGASLA